MENDVEFRKNELIRIKNSFADKIPVICERDPKSNLKDIDRTKYILPEFLTVSQFTYMIKKKVLPDYSEIPLYLLFNGKDCISGDKTIKEIYEKYKDSQDGLLYIGYTDNLNYI